jgi:hypothetical protein
MRSFRWEVMRIRLHGTWSVSLAPPHGIAEIRGPVSFKEHGPGPVTVAQRSRQGGFSGATGNSGLSAGVAAPAQACKPRGAGAHVGKDWLWPGAALTHTSVRCRGRAAGALGAWPHALPHSRALGRRATMTITPNERGCQHGTRSCQQQDNSPTPRALPHIMGSGPRTTLAALTIQSFLAAAPSAAHPAAEEAALHCTAHIPFLGHPGKQLKPAVALISSTGALRRKTKTCGGAFSVPARALMPSEAGKDWWTKSSMRGMRPRTAPPLHCAACGEAPPGLCGGWPTRFQRMCCRHAATWVWVAAAAGGCQKIIARHK